MRISTKGRYSLEALLFLAVHSDKTFVSTREIAQGTGYSEGYLEQLFIPLRNAGLLKGARGPMGGYCLAKSPADISAGDILRAVEGNLKLTDCLDKSDACPESASCPGRGAWRAIYSCITDTADSTTLASLREAYRRSNPPAPEYVI